MQTFRDFEKTGWEDRDICAQYDAHLAAVTVQSAGVLLDAAGVRSGTATLDVATGAGYVAAAAAARGSDATGVDFSATQVALARERYPALRFERADADALPFDDATFDAVVCAFGVCHFPDPDAALRDAFRVLRPGGRLAFTVWAAPERTVALGATYGALRAHGSIDVGLPAGPNFFLFSDERASADALTRAGFETPLFTEVEQTWRVANADEAFAALMHGTVRAAATLRAQTPGAIAAVRNALRDTVERYRTGDACTLPMPAALSSAVKPRAATATIAGA